MFFLLCLLWVLTAKNPNTPFLAHFNLFDLSVLTRFLLLLRLIQHLNSENNAFAKWRAQFPHGLWPNLFFLFDVFYATYHKLSGMSTVGKKKSVRQSLFINLLPLRWRHGTGMRTCRQGLLRFAKQGRSLRMLDWGIIGFGRSR